MYEVVLFDVDGVLLSEKRCFDATTLSVWELLYSEHALGLQGATFHASPDEAKIEEIRKQVFHDEQVLSWLKARGINSNWDMVALLFGFQLQELLKQLNEIDPAFVEKVLNYPLNQRALVKIGNQAQQSGLNFEPDFGAILDVLEEAGTGETNLLYRIKLHVQDWSGMRVDSFHHGSQLWRLGREVYQEWYLGAELFEKVEEKQARYPEKQGFLHQEIPLADPDVIADMLDGLIQRGIELGIGTGRPALETEVPLQSLGLYSAFEPDRIVTADDVRYAEEVYPDYAPLGKPEPFTYVKAFIKRQASDAKSVAADLPLSGADKILIVGDSVADLLAARKIGCRFAATLTGQAGQEARSKFEEMGADYILDDVTQLSAVIEEEAAKEQQKEAEQSAD